MASHFHPDRIAQSLSTFSSHIGRVRRIIDAAETSTAALVLLDEVCRPRRIASANSAVIRRDARRRWDRAPTRRRARRSARRFYANSPRLPSSRCARRTTASSRRSRRRTCGLRTRALSSTKPRSRRRTGCCGVRGDIAEMRPRRARDGPEMRPPTRHTRSFERSDDRLAARSRSRRDLRREIASRGGRCGGGRRRRLVAGARSAICSRLSATFALDLPAIYPRLSAISGAAGRAALGGRGARRDASGG